MIGSIWSCFGGLADRPRLRAVGHRLVTTGLTLLVVTGFGVGCNQSELASQETRSGQPTPTLATGPTATEPAPATLQPTTPPTPVSEPTVGAQATLSATAEPISPTPTPTQEVALEAYLPVRLVIPGLGIDAQVVELGWKVQEVDGRRTSVWRLEDISNGLAGHLSNSALPGQADNVVIAGHHNIEGEVFRGISEAWTDEGAEVLKENLQWRSRALEGQAITLHDAAGQQFTYIVEAMYKLADKDVPLAQRMENGRFMESTSEPTLTLVTCWPYDNNTHRVVVVARLASRGS